MRTCRKRTSVQIQVAAARPGRRSEPAVRTLGERLCDRYAGRGNELTDEVLEGVGAGWDGGRRGRRKADGGCGMHSARSGLGWQ
jgi:hypothetical protein